MANLNVQVLCPSIWHIISPPHVHKVHGCSPGTLASGGSSHPLPGRLAGVCSLGGAVLRQCDLAPAALNRRKSRLRPSEVTEFLSMYLDARAGTLSLTPGRQATLKACWRLCLRLLGLMAATVHVVPLALLNMHPVQCCLLSLGLCPQGNLQARVLVTCRLCVALCWWELPSCLTGQCIGASVTSPGKW